MEPLSASSALNALPALLQIEFGEAFKFVVWIVNFLMLYRLAYPDMIQSKVVALVVVVIVMFLVVIPFDWFAYLLFIMLFMYAMFWTFKPYRW